MTNPFDLKAVAAALGDHLAAGGAPIAQELLESGLAKILPTLQSMAQTGEQTALNSLADRETQGLDWVTATLLPALDKMLDAKIDRLMKARVTVGFEEPK